MYTNYYIVPMEFEMTKIELDETLIKSYHSDGKSIREIAEIFGCGKTTMRRRFKSLGLPTKKSRKGIKNLDKTKSRVDLSGRKFGILTVIKYDNLSEFKLDKWLCQCECGNYKYSRNFHLQRGRITSCGCKRNNSGPNNWKWSRFEEIPTNLLYTAETGAKKRNLEYSVSNDYIWGLFLKQDRKCALSGIELTFSKSSKEKSTASLDRIDSSKGYIEGNLQWVHKTINVMKMALSQEEFIQWCEMVYKNN